MLVAKSGLAFCSHAQRLTKSGFAEVFGLMREHREWLGSRAADFATSITVGSGPIPAALPIIDAATTSTPEQISLRNPALACLVPTTSYRVQYRYRADLQARAFRPYQVDDAGSHPRAALLIETVHEHGAEDHRALDELHPERLHVPQRQPVVDEADDEHAE